VLNEQFERMRWYSSKLSPFFADLRQFAPVRWFIGQRDRIASYLYIVCMAGFAYWVYRLMIIDVKPQMDRLVFIEDSRDALTFLFFGLFGLIYVLFFASFIVKFVYNIIRSGIDSLVPAQWYSLVRSALLLLCLNFAFLYIQNIKTAGLTAYMQFVEILHTSKEYTPVVRKNVDILRLLEDVGREPRD